MKDNLFKILLWVAAMMIVLLTAGFLFALTTNSVPIFKEMGFWNFVTSAKWDNNTYGALAFICGTLITSLLALIIAVPFSMAVALCRGEYLKKRKISIWTGSIIDLLAGVPSIVFGLWGFYTLRPVIISLGISQYGFGVLLSSVVLAIMILPYISSLSSEFISMVSDRQKEAAYALGATRWEVIKYVIFPSAGSGIVTSFVLALGRALGETMAVTMLIGNTFNIPTSLSDTANTMASIIANQFGEATGLKMNALFAIGLLLMFITMLINLAARTLMKTIKK